jgi:Flp pilus assembly pilin Flp
MTRAISASATLTGAQRGQAVVEYALMLVMLSVILIVTLTFMDHQVRNLVCNITSQLSPLGLGGQ